MIDRPYDVGRLYGTTIEALIEEEFGDGIMSVNDLELDFVAKRIPTVIGSKSFMTGKFLKSKKNGMAGAAGGQGKLAWRVGTATGPRVGTQLAPHSFIDRRVKKPNRGPNCGAKTPMPLPSRSS